MGMATHDKFQFESCFDDAVLEAEAAAAAAARKEAEEPPEPTFSEEELIAARAEGHAEGYAAGHAEAEAATERATAQALAVIGEGFAGLGEAQAKSHQADESTALALAAAIARKCLPEMVRDDAVPAIEALVRDSLPLFLDEPRVVVRICDNLVKPIKARIGTLAAESGFAGETVYLGDPTLVDGDCRIEWADGGVTRDMGDMWEQIDAITRKFLDTFEPREAAPEPASEPDSTSTDLSGP
jgi:flagellar assembly protein FliH